MERINTPFTNEHFVAFLRAFVGRPYWYGTCVYRCTNSLLLAKTEQYTKYYGSSRQPRYKKDIANKEVCADCGGLGKGYVWTNGGVGVLESIGTGSSFENKSGSNGCPDYGATNMFNYAKSLGMEWGTIDTLPELAGLALWKSGHVGYYIGNGQLIEEKGFDYGCVISNVADRNFECWYKLPWIDYNEASGIADISFPLIKKGSTGYYVSIMQGYLVSLGYNLGSYGENKDGVDGKFGSITDGELKKFQSANGLTADGVCGSVTWAMLKLRVEGQDEDSDLEQVEIPDTIREGSANSELVMKLQEILNTWTLKQNPVPFKTLKVDGIFGWVTDAAVKKYQKANGLKEDGIVGKITWGFLLS